MSVTVSLSSKCRAVLADCDVEGAILSRLGSGSVAVLISCRRGELALSFPVLEDGGRSEEFLLRAPEAELLGGGILVAGSWLKDKRGVGDQDQSRREVYCFCVRFLGQSCIVTCSRVTCVKSASMQVNEQIV